MEGDGPYAIVGLPCQVHSLVKAITVLPKLASKVSFIIGLFCAVNIEPSGIEHLLRARGFDLSEAGAVRFRYGAWPGGVYAWLRGGDRVMLYPREANEGNQVISFLKWTWGQSRCLLCPDPANTLADMSAGDPWVRDRRGHYVYEDQAGVTAVVCRTESALACLKELSHAGQMQCVEAELAALLPTKTAVCTAKRRKVARRVLSRRSSGRPYPDYGLSLEVPRMSAVETVVETFVFRLFHLPLVRFLFLPVALSWVGHRFARLNIIRKQWVWRIRKGRRSKDPPVMEGRSKGRSA